MPTQAYAPDFFYEVIPGGDVLLYPNPDSAAARNFYAHEVFSNDARLGRLCDDKAVA